MSLSPDSHAPSALSRIDADVDMADLNAFDPHGLAVLVSDTEDAPVQPVQQPGDFGPGPAYLPGDASDRVFNGAALELAIIVAESCTAVDTWNEVYSDTRYYNNAYCIGAPHFAASGWNALARVNKTCYVAAVHSQILRLRQFVECVPVCEDDWELEMKGPNLMTAPWSQWLAALDTWLAVPGNSIGAHNLFLPPGHEDRPPFFCYMLQSPDWKHYFWPHVTAAIIGQLFTRQGVISATMFVPSAAFKLVETQRHAKLIRRSDFDRKYILQTTDHNSWSMNPYRPQYSVVMWRDIEFTDELIGRLTYYHDLFSKRYTGGPDGVYSIHRWCFDVELHTRVLHSEQFVMSELEHRAGYKKWWCNHPRLYELVLPVYIQSLWYAAIKEEDDCGHYAHWSSGGKVVRRSKRHGKKPNVSSGFAKRGVCMFMLDSDTDGGCEFADESEPLQYSGWGAGMGAQPPQQGGWGAQ